jgi:hypothetical protein
VFVFLAWRSCQRACERLSRKRELIYLDLALRSRPRTPPSIRDRQSSTLNISLCSVVTRVPAQPMDRGGTVASNAVQDAQEFMRAVHAADNLAFHQAPQRRFRADFISTWSLGSTLAVKEITQRWCNCLQPGPSSQVARVVVQNMMAVAGRSGQRKAWATLIETFETFV